MSLTIREKTLTAFRRNRVPALVIQSCAAVILALYFLVPAARPAFEAIAGLRARNGYLFSATSTAISGGVVSWLVLWRRGRIPPGKLGSHALFFLLYWAAQGLIVDTLYRFQSQWFGDGHDAWTLFKKVLVDQGPYNMLYATPASMMFYSWKDHNFSWSATWQACRKDFKQRYWSIMISAWIIWIPAVCMIYMLPPDLQIPLFNLVISFFVLVLAVVSREPDADADSC